MSELHQLAAQLTEEGYYNIFGRAGARTKAAAPVHRRRLRDRHRRLRPRPRLGLRLHLGRHRLVLLRRRLAHGVVKTLGFEDEGNRRRLSRASTAR